ncbi:MAG: LamG domain-containing protein, partial [Planctomycetaceae bacterium]
MHKFAALAVLLAVACPGWSSSADSAEMPDPYAVEVSRDKPAAWWRFNTTGSPFASHGTVQLPATPTSSVQAGVPGPRPPFYPLFASANLSVRLSGSDRLVVADPGDTSPLDFTNGDAITLEAWVQLNRIGGEQNIYVIGKGRTNNKGQVSENQNWALRLTGRQGTARVSFLFRNARNRSGVRNDFHRWIAAVGFPPGDSWHHVAVTYLFGKPDTLRGYLDGEPIAGTWDLGGKTTEPPVVDNDEVWIGSTLGGNPGTTLPGRIDEVAIYRAALTPARLAAHFKSNRPDPRLAEIPDSKLPGNAVLVELIEGVPAKNSWDFPRTRPVERWQQPAAAWVGLPRRYSSAGLIVDRPAPFLLRARTRLHLSPGKYRFVLRARNAARLSIDGQLVASTGFLSRNASGHEAVPGQVKSDRDDLVDLSPGHNQALADVTLEPGTGDGHLVLLETFVGGEGVRTELGELMIGFAPEGKSFRLLSAEGSPTIGLSEIEWDRYILAFEQQLVAWNDQERRTSDPLEQEYWKRRHRLARQAIPEVPLPGTDSSLAAVDRWLKA